MARISPNWTMRSLTDGKDPSTRMDTLTFDTSGTCKTTVLRPRNFLTPTLLLTSRTLTGSSSDSNSRLCFSERHNMNNDPMKIRITVDDIERAQVYPSATPVGVPPPPPVTGPRDWGSITGVSSTGAGAMAGGNPFLTAWVYLGLAGLAGAFFAWAICEPAFVDGVKTSWGNVMLFPMLITAICLGFAAAESFAERSVQKATIRGLLALALGLVLGFLFTFIATVIYQVGMRAIAESGGEMQPSNPLIWFVRAIAWMIFGVTGGIVYGIAGQSGKKCLYGILGGVIGAGIGGLLFDPISLLTGGGGPSRCIGMMIFGASTGVAIGFVESALKDRWLYVSGGPLAGKQFILYKPVTQLGSQQANEIYLFKDPSIGPVHARIELRGAQTILTATGPTFVAGQPVAQRVLRSGDLIQIGRYTFQFHEKRSGS
jgi:hypothetical protein